VAGSLRSEREATPDLHVPREPSTLRGTLHRAAVEDPDGASVLIGKELSLWLWRSWCDALRARGVTRSEVRAVLVDDRREAWLWVMGERTWAQLIDGLIGRVNRRLVDRV